MIDSSIDKLGNSGITICSLTKVGLERWFDIEPKPRDVEGAIRKLDSAMAFGQIDPDLRLVALKDNIVVARLSARLDPSGRFYFWAPTYCQTLPQSLWPEVAHSFLNHFQEYSATRQGLRFFETRPADDVPGLEEWLTVLGKNGFHEIACGRIYDHLILESQPDFRPSSRLKLVPCNSVNEEVIRNLLWKCDRGTLDRVDAQYREQYDEHWSEIKSSRSVPWDPAFSIVAFLNDEPAALLLAGRERGTNDSWILYVGVASGKRRQYIGAELLQAAVRSFGQSGIHRARALIDDLNVPSIQLHRSIGFRARPGRFMTYRKVLSVLNEV